VTTPLAAGVRRDPLLPVPATVQDTGAQVTGQIRDLVHVRNRAAGILGAR